MDDISGILNIFNFDLPLCLFCQNYLEINNTSSNNLSFDRFICTNCNEIFCFGYYNDTLTNMSFTCLNIEVTIYSSKPHYTISSARIVDNIHIPAFNIDFSDKNKLFEKLHTYIIFS
jgi:hypothetical protein